LPKSGVQISYQRFLGDSASGIVLFVFILLAIFYRTPLFGYVVPLDIATAPEKPLLALAFLLALLLSPVGLFINSISYMVLGRWEKRAVNLFLSSEKYGVENLLENHFFHKWKNFYDVNEAGLNGKPILWYGYFEVVNSLFALYSRPLLEVKSHILGVAQFARSIAFLVSLVFLNLVVNSVVVEGYFNFSEFILYCSILVFCFIVLMYAVGFLAVYAAVKIFSLTYMLLVTAQPKLTEKTNLSTDECMRHYAKSAGNIVS